MRRSIALASFIILCFIPARTVLSADNPSMAEILVTNNGNDLIFFSYLRDGFPRISDERLQSGLPMTFTYYVELRKKRALWVNSRVAFKTFVNSVKYDNLREEYIYTKSEGEQKETRVTKDYKEMQRWVTILEGAKLIDYNQLEPGEKYYVRVKAEIKPLSAPFPLKYLKPFFPFLDQDTSWQESMPFAIKP